MPLRVPHQLNMTLQRKQQHPHDLLAQGDFPPRAHKPPVEGDGGGDWLLFPGTAPAPTTPPPPAPTTDPAFQPLGIDSNAWQKSRAKAHRIPSPGRHLVIVRSAWLKPPANGGGDVLSIVLEVVDGPDIGATILCSFSISSNNPRAKQIALFKLSQLTTSGGMAGMPQKVGDLVGLVVDAVIVHKPHWQDVNQVQAYAERFYAPEEV